MAMIGKVLRMHSREKKSVREIAKATSLARNTVRRYLRIDKAEATSQTSGSGETASPACLSWSWLSICTSPSTTRTRSPSSGPPAPRKSWPK